MNILKKTLKKQVVVLFTIVFVILALSSCSENETKVDKSTGVCKIISQHSGWNKSLKKAQDNYNLSPAFAMAIIYQESNFDANASSKYSSAHGYAQAINGTWKNFQKDVKTNAKRNNFDDSVQFMGWYMSSLSKSLKLNMSDSTNLYMAYMLGATGFKRYRAGTFKNKNKIIEDKKIAAKVTSYAKIYESQFKKCKV
jgi:hypothetical protein